MRLLITAASLLAAVMAVGGCEDTASSTAAPAMPVPQGSGFDFYVLALSWSPSYCASYGERANKQQCDTDDPFAFVVHGLWPQFERGYPAACPTDRPLRVPREISDEMLDIMPSTGLIRHEWREHGTCTGLSQVDYFAVTRMAYEKIAVPDHFGTAAARRTIDPDAVEDAFVAANPGMPDNAIAVTCDRRYLRDVRICLTLDLSGFVACPEVDANACRMDDAVMPPIR